jgi:hypothetical protein
MTPEQLARLDAAAAAVPSAPGVLAGSAAPSPAWLVAAAWLAVGIPLVWGVWMTLQKAAPLVFR